MSGLVERTVSAVKFWSDRETDEAARKLQPLDPVEAVDQERLQKFQVAVANNRKASSRSIISKLVSGSVVIPKTTHYWDYMEDDFVGIVDKYGADGSYQRLMDRKISVGVETGRRTRPFSHQQSVVGSLVVTEAWEVGFVEDREIQNPVVNTTLVEHPGGSGVILESGGSGQQIEPSDNADRPIRVWRTATSETPGGRIIEQRQVVYDIDKGTGVVTARADEFQDDLRGFSALAHASGIVGLAIEFVEQ